MQEHRDSARQNKPVLAGRPRVRLSVFDRPVRPGHDYPFTETVRCKSRNEREGVAKRATNCVPRYLLRTLTLSPAGVIVAFGRRARQELRRLTGYADYGPVSPRLQVGGRERRLAFLAHRNAKQSKKQSRYSKQLDPDALERVRALVEDELRSRRYHWEAGDDGITRMPGDISPRDPDPGPAAVVDRRGALAVLLLSTATLRATLGKEGFAIRSAAQSRLRSTTVKRSPRDARSQHLVELRAVSARPVATSVDCAKSDGWHSDRGGVLMVLLGVGWHVGVSGPRAARSARGRPVGCGREAGRALRAGRVAARASTSIRTWRGRSPCSCARLSVATALS